MHPALKNEPKVIANVKLGIELLFILSFVVVIMLKQNSSVLFRSYLNVRQLYATLYYFEVWNLGLKLKKDENHYINVFENLKFAAVLFFN